MGYKWAVVHTSKQKNKEGLSVRKLSDVINELKEEGYNIIESTALKHNEE